MVGFCSHQPRALLCSGCAPPAVPVPSALRACVQAWLGCMRGGNGANPDVASMNGREKAFQGVQPCTLLRRGLAGWPQNPERCVQGGGCCHPFPPLLHRSCVHRGISLPQREKNLQSKDQAKELLLVGVSGMP